MLQLKVQAMVLCQKYFRPNLGKKLQKILLWIAQLPGMKFLAHDNKVIKNKKIYLDNNILQDI